MALSHAILTALNNNACSGYDLAKQFDGSVGFFWNASHQQIYRELTKLEESGYIEATVVHTSTGRDYLRTWIAQPSTVAYPKDELLVKLFAGDIVDRSIILCELEHHRAQHQDRLDIYQSIEQQIFPNIEALDRSQRYQYLTLRQGIRLESEWLNWYMEVIEFI
jgi:DNA-binding PadR family transcriptional regulator